MISFSKNITVDTSEKPEQEVNLKKYDCDRRNEIIKVAETPCSVPNSYGDRFIPRRYNSQNRHFLRPTIMNRINRDNRRDNDIFYTKNCDGYWRRYAIKRCFESNFKDKTEEVLIFHDWLTKEVCKKTLNLNINRNVAVFDNTNKFDWPCSPRRRAIATTEISHVINNYVSYSHLNVISWSSTGNLAASFGEDLVLWIPKGKSLLTYAIKGITALAYSNDGKYIAVGVKVDRQIYPQIQMWDVSSDSIGIFVSSFEYSVYDDDIRCIIWDPKTRYIVSGMVHGNVHIHKFNASLEIVKTLSFTKYCVNDLQLSANQTFLAASDDEGNVYVWNFKTFELVFHWTEKNMVKALIAWHPWKETYLIISSTMPTSICLIDVKAKEMIAYYNRTDKLCKINAITFNPISAELVVSVTMYDDISETYEILVLAALDRVVDLLNIHDGCVKCLLWNHDGSMLATAGDDNMLNIWNFFGLSRYQPAKPDSGRKCDTSKFILANPSLFR